MKKRFLPFSLLLVIMILGQSVIADQGGHYVPRKQINNAESYMGSLRANQKTGLIDPADMLKAMQAPATRDASDDPLYWINMGPDNMGGQTTAIVYDNRSTGVVYIGSKGGGVYKSYNQGLTWHQVGGLNLMVSCMVQDANGVIYVGTGDGEDALAHNGLGDQGYDNSFVGTGLYTLVNDVFEQVVAPTEDAWLFVNDLAVAGDKVLAATNEGLMCSADGGRNWSVAVEGKAVSVKVGSDNTIVAAVGGHVYVGRDVNHLVDHSGTTNALQGDSLLPQGVDGGLIDLAIAPSDVNTIYVSLIGTNGIHSGVYVSNDKGNTWRVALPAVTVDQGHNIYAGVGLYNHGLVVDPENADILYVLGYNLWSLTATTSNGFFMANQLTGQSYYYLSNYIHVGIHTLVFNPNNSQECYVGTDGGIYKATGRFTFSNCNRNYVTTRMFGVAYSGKDTRVLAGGVDHGTVYIPGDANGNTLEWGYWINPRGDNLGMYNDGSDAGSCAFSTINSNTIFVSYRRRDDVDNKKPWVARSATLGEDWVSTNFTSGVSLPASTSFRVPFLLHENYNNQLNPETAWFFNETEQRLDAGTTVQVISNNGYPFDYTLTANLAAGDSIEVHDPITSYFFLAYTDAFYMTRTPLQFDKEAVWYRVAEKSSNGGVFKGDPLSMDISADGNTVFVGFKDGKVYRISNLNAIVDGTTGNCIINSNQHNPDFVGETKSITFDGIADRCITSVAIDPRDNNKVLITCGNYGNDAYVFYSTNAMAEEPTFVSKQGNLPKMPVYSSVIDMTTGDVIIGTERGIYRSKDLNSWTPDSEALGAIPDMELKQQRAYIEDAISVNHTDEGDFVTEYPGVKNTGIIYAATYGRGVFRCENYKKTFASVPENSSEDNVNLSMYPNPVSSQATLSFDLKESCNVSYQVFDLTGRMVMNQNMGRMCEGEQQININAENLSSGSYILRLNQGAKNNSVKFMVY